jgi:flagellar protein FliO/FliZ
MTQSLVAVGLFLAILVSLPWLIKLLQSRYPRNGHSVDNPSRVLSAVAVGPHQRVVTVEVGPENGRMILVLGVTQQSIVCLHSAASPVAFSSEVTVQ